MLKQLLFFVLAGILTLAACAPVAQPAATQPAAPASAAAEAPAGAAAPPGFEGKAWGNIVAAARGQTVNFYMWGGSDVINGWVTGYVAQTLKERYGITLVMTPVSDAPEFINKILGEKQAGRDKHVGHG